MHSNARFSARRARHLTRLLHHDVSRNFRFEGPLGRKPNPPTPSSQPQLALVACPILGVLCNGGFTPRPYFFGSASCSSGMPYMPEAFSLAQDRALNWIYVAAADCLPQSSRGASKVGGRPSRGTAISGCAPLPVITSMPAAGGQSAGLAPRMVLRGAPFAPRVISRGALCAPRWFYGATDLLFAFCFVPRRWELSVHHEPRRAPT